MRNSGAASIGKLRFLVLQPTRELAAQCYSMLQNLSRYLNHFSSAAIYGGSSIRQQKRDLDNTPDFVVATTGRLLDHVHNTKGFSLEDVEVLVLDEADRLIEMGFKDEVASIVRQCRNPNRQTIMVSATLNQDLKELATMTLKEALTFSVQQQQRKADLANLKLAQYLIRLKFDDVEKRAPRVSRKDREASQKKKRKRRDWNDPDFDSEAEYNSEVDSNEEPLEDDSDVEYDDGKMSDEDVLNAEESDSDMDSIAEEEGELELSEDLEEEEPATKAEAKKPAAGDDYMFEKEDGGAVSGKPEQKNSKKAAEEKVVEEPVYFDRYRMDPLLVRRESALILLCLKQFKQRVIIFFNEKKQVGRVHALFAFFGLKAVEVHGDLNQKERLGNVEAFQKGEADFLLATDLVARGIDISAVKAVLNFSFPTEPKRYLHRVGRTARAGSTGQAITLCNDEERKDIKKLLRKLNQKLLPYSLNQKLVVLTHDFIKTKLDPLLREIQLEQQQDKEKEYE